MIRYFPLFSLLFSINQIISAQSVDHLNIDDGPFIFRKDNKTVIKWVKNGYVKHKNLTPETFNDLRREFDFTFPYREINQTFNTNHEYKFTFRGVDSIAVISDIHGEFNKYLLLLRSQGIIDHNNRWSFGKGHLVILGDCFDRGDKVTELLWHIFGLEKEAEKSGGMVHMLLGNHEVMVLGEDLRYTNEKYLEVEKLTGIKYMDFYSNESLLGIWLRNKPVMISINDVIFVHAGISPELIRREMSIEDINHLFYQMQVLREVESENDLKKLDFLNEDYGPIWYRGYFDDPCFSEAQADSILAFFGKQHIIVGHTTNNDFKSLFGKKIIGIDAGIGSDKVYMEGAALIIKQGAFYKGTRDGRREALYDSTGSSSSLSREYPSSQNHQKR